MSHAIIITIKSLQLRITKEQLLKNYNLHQFNSIICPKIFFDKNTLDFCSKLNSYYVHEHPLTQLSSIVLRDDEKSEAAMAAKNSDFLTLPLLHVAPPNLAKDTETLRKPFLYLFQKWNGKSWTMRESIVRAQSHDRAVDYRWLVNVLYVIKCKILLFPISIFQIGIQMYIQRMMRSLLSRALVYSTSSLCNFNGQIKPELISEVILAIQV